MLTLNLAALGVTEEALTSSILSQLGMSREQAVKALADKLGVKFPSVDTSSIKSGDTVQTAYGSARAFVLTEDELAALTKVGSVFSRLAS